MNHQVQVFEIDTATKPTEALRPIDGFAVTADTLDEARTAATERLTADGRVVRCLSFLKDGGFASVVYAPAPPPARSPPTSRSTHSATAPSCPTGCSYIGTLAFVRFSDRIRLSCVITHQMVH
ncbi:MAG: hypothetical protein ACRD2A_06725 [Vicinamibacterales bacterium]